MSDRAVARLGLAAALAVAAVAATDVRAEVAPETGAPAAHAAAPAAVVAPGPTVTAADAERLALDYAVPTFPAFAFLGTTPTQIQQPGSIKDLAIDLANGLDDDGRIKAGVALAVRPGVLVPALSRARGLELSLGTVRTPLGESDSATDAALGARWTLIDRGEPWGDASFRNEVMNMLRDTSHKECPIPPPPGGEPSTAAREQRARSYHECVEARAARAKEQYEATHWNALRVELGAATGWRMPGANPLEDGSFFLGHAWWALASGALPGGWLRAHGQWTTVVQLSQRRELEGGAFSEELRAGARAFIGPHRLHAYGEVIFEARRRADEMTDSDARDWDWSLGGEVRISDGNWLVLGVRNSADADDDMQFLGSWRWGLSTTPTIAAIPR